MIKKFNDFIGEDATNYNLQNASQKQKNDRFDLGNPVLTKLAKGVKFEDVEGAVYTVINADESSVVFKSDENDENNFWNGKHTITGYKKKPFANQLFYKIKK